MFLHKVQGQKSLHAVLNVYLSIRIKTKFYLKFSTQHQIQRHEQTEYSACGYWVKQLQWLLYHSSIKASVFHITFQSINTPAIGILLTTFWTIFLWRLLTLGNFVLNFLLTLKIDIKHFILQCQFKCPQHRSNLVDDWFTHEYHNSFSHVIITP